jgi:hypothetical protein
MFRAPLCLSSGARDYYTSGFCLLCVRFAGYTGHTTLSSTLYRQFENQTPNTTGRNHLYNNLELLMMGIMVPETCWASNKICNKNSSVASSWHFISTYYRRCTVKVTSNTLSLYLFSYFDSNQTQISLSVGYISYFSTYVIITVFRFCEISVCFTQDTWRKSVVKLGYLSGASVIFPDDTTICTCR